MKIAVSNANIARACNGSALVPAARRNIRQYVSNINIRVSLMRRTNICILWLYMFNICACTFNFSQVIFRPDMNPPTVQSNANRHFAVWCLYYPSIFSASLYREEGGIVECNQTKAEMIKSSKYFPEFFSSWPENNKQSQFPKFAIIWNLRLFFPHKYIINMLYRRNTVIALFAFMECAIFPRHLLKKRRISLY